MTHFGANYEASYDNDEVDERLLILNIKYKLLI